MLFCLPVGSNGTLSHKAKKLLLCVCLHVCVRWVILQRERRGLKYYVVTSLAPYYLSARVCVLIIAVSLSVMDKIFHFITEGVCVCVCVCVCVETI